MLEYKIEIIKADEGYQIICYKWAGSYIWTIDKQPQQTFKNMEAVCKWLMKHNAITS